LWHSGGRRAGQTFFPGKKLGGKAAMAVVKAQLFSENNRQEYIAKAVGASRFLKNSGRFNN